MPGGRPSKLKPETKKRLVDALFAGNCKEPACASAGITYQTFLNWMQRGRKAKSGEYFEFFEEVTRAIADAEIRAVTLISKAGEDDWRAASWMLERRHPDRWANTQRIKFEAQKQTNEVLGYLLSAVSESAKAEIANALTSIGSDPGVQSEESVETPENTEPEQ